MRKWFLLILTLVIFPRSVLATTIDSPNYKVEAAYITADIDVVGSMHVKEAYVVKGALNGYERKIRFRNSSFLEWEEGKVNFEESSFYNARGLSLSKISAEKITKDEIGWELLGKTYEKFEEKSNAHKGDTGIYTKSTNQDGYDVKIFNTNESDYIVYYFDYYVDQVVTLHNDIAEIYYTFFKLDTDDVGEVNIQLTTPVVGTSEKFRFWAHATEALNGTISGITDKKNDKGEDLFRGVLLKMEDYKMGEVIDIRLTFDKSLYVNFEDILNNSKMDALDKIVEIETERANEVNSKRKIIKLFYYGSYAFGILYLVGLIIIWIYLYRKYDKEYNVGFDHKYYREFTGDYSVEVVDYLMNKNISTNALNASIMNLIYKKNIEIEELTQGDKNNSKNILLKLKNKENVTGSESYLLDLLFTTIGHGKDAITLKEIEDFSSNYKTANDFMLGYNKWHMSVESDAKKEGFYENYTSVKTAASMYFILGLMICGLFTLLRIENIIMMIAIIVGAVAFLIYVLSFKKWTRKGREHYLKWNAFKNFLTDFGSLKDKEIPEIALWEKYLVYATVFGIAKQVQKSMNVKLTEMGLEEESIPIYYRNYYMYNSINTCMSSAHNKSVSTINQHNASSSMSSGGGFGGGFSSGGGHAGGGGGGGGF